MIFDPKTKLQRIQRDIIVEKRLRKQKRDRQEDFTDVTERINQLRKQAREIIQQMEAEKCA